MLVRDQADVPKALVPAEGAPVAPEPPEGISPKAPGPSVKTIAWSKSKRKRAEEGGDGSGSEPPSSAFGVKSFEEIMREKKARQQQG